LSFELEFSTIVTDSEPKFLEILAPLNCDFDWQMYDFLPKKFNYFVEIGYN